MFPVAVGDAPLTKIIKDSFDYIFSLDANRIPFSFYWHLLNSEDVEAFIFDFESKNVRSLSLHGLASRKDRQGVDGPIHVVRGHVYNATAVSTSSKHLRPQESIHHDHWEGIYVGRLNKFLIRRFVDLALTGIESLYIIDKNGNVVRHLFASSFLLN